MVTVILVQEIIQYSLITCEFVSIVLVSLGITVANSHVLPDAKEALRESSLPLLCVYMEVCFLFIFSLFLHLLPLRNFLSPNSVWRGGDGGNLVCSAPHGAFSVWREVRL